METTYANKSIDKELVSNRFRKSIHTYNKYATVQKHIANKLYQIIHQLPDIDYSNVLELGCGTGFLTQKLASHNIVKYTANDIVDNYRPLINTILSRKNISNINYLWADAENFDFDEKFSLITSASTVQWFSDIGIFLSRIRYSLHRGGYIVFSSFDSNNFSELKQINNYGLETPGFNNLKITISKYFELVSAQKEEKKLYFRSPVEVLRHLKLTGVNATNKKIWTKTDLANFEKGYEKHFEQEKGYSLTYCPVYIVARKISE